ncbi:MAG: type I methionyl aminopeptidase [Chloroflexi bacterium]|nr:type I methionyl aminopeptidase [Chloroflexota bacterium]
MTVENENDLAKLLRIGKICALALQHMLERIEPGMTTAQLDAIGAAFLKQHGARSAPILAYRFPGHICISLNHEAAHGIPGSRRIQPGDLINVDVSAELEGYWADTGASAIVPPSRPEYEALCQAAREARSAGINAAYAGRPLNAIGRAVEAVAKRTGYQIIRDLGGHGVGRHIHEKPNVPNHYDRSRREKLTEGLVITIEPFLTTGRGQILTARDNWTLKTADKMPVAQYEHTIVINGSCPIIVTAP